MKAFVLCALVALVSAEEAAEAPAAAAVPLVYGGFPFYHHAPLTYVHQPVQYKYVPKEYEVEVKSFQPELVQTGCVNSFGTPVPCREKRSADEAAEETPIKVEAPYYYAPTIYGAPAVAPLTYTHHVAAPVALSHPLTYAAPVVHTVEPKVHEIEVPTPVYKNVVEKVPLQPLCQNHLGLAVPCA